MRRNVTKSLVAAALAVGLVSQSEAGWMETGDAGGFYQGDGLQETVGSGDLGTISGSTVIPDPNAPGTFFRELVDVFSIRVTDPDSFYATTDTAIDSRASTSGDSRLFLIDPASGDLVLMNDDISNANLASYIGESATFATATGNTVHASAAGVDLVAGGLYYLAIAEFAITPLDGFAELDQAPVGFPLGADHAYADTMQDPLNTNDGADGNLSLVGSIRSAGNDPDWGSRQLQANPPVPLAGLDYVIALGGATYAVPEPGTLAIALLAMLSGSVVVLRRRFG